MTKQNLWVSIGFWAIGISFALAIWAQHDNTSTESAAYLLMGLAGVYCLAIAIYLIRKKLKSS